MFKGQKHNADIFPTDSEILLNVVCVWFDSLFHTAIVKDEFGAKEPSFLSLHLKDLLLSDLTELKKEGYWGFVIDTPRVKPSQTHIKGTFLYFLK